MLNQLSLFDNDKDDNSNNLNGTLFYNDLNINDVKEDNKFNESLLKESLLDPSLNNQDMLEKIDSELDLDVSKNNAKIIKDPEKFIICALNAMNFQILP